MEQTSMERRYDEFFEWIKSRGVTLDERITVKEINQGNNGLIATTEIPKNTLLFQLPRPLTPTHSSSPILNVQTSQLFSLLNFQDQTKLSKDWLPLLLVLLWEHARASLTSDSWAPYFNTLPREFDTLMFWNSDELRELTGSTILNKIGKEEAEEDYHEIIKPIIKSRGDIFPVPLGTTWEENYGLSMYHRMGSLILSRSFHVEPSTPKNNNQTDIAGDYVDVSMDTALESINDSVSVHQDISLDDVDQEEEEEDLGREPIEHIALLPLADLLNAKSGSENAKLFYETDSLKMKTTKKIYPGEQIYNTYGNPPNSDLLRRYGHVDDPNRFDLVEITVQTCLLVAQSFLSSDHSNSLETLSLDDLESRVEWALEMGLDEVFEIPTELERKSNGSPILPEELICMLKILLLSSQDFITLKAKEKLPKPKLNNEDIIILAQRLIDQRLSEYLTSIDEDERLLKELQMNNNNKNTSDYRKIKAIIVRKSEKEILMILRGLSMLYPKSVNKLAEPARPYSHTNITF